MNGSKGSATQADVPDFPPSLKAVPTIASAVNGRFRVYVCQASYGDTLALEIDPTPPVRDNNNLNENYEKKRINSKSRRVILIDGGPGINKPTGKLNYDVMPLYNLYKMLRELVPLGSNKLDTLVVTHDDLDHIIGIAELLRRLNAKTPDKLWLRGTVSVVEKRAPFANIWHNSAGLIQDAFTLGKTYTARRDEKDDTPVDPPTKKGKGKGDSAGKTVGKKDAPKKKVKVQMPRGQGYFDLARNIMKNKHGIDVPDFNAEFKPSSGKRSKDKYESLVHTTLTTTRGHANFQFLGPDEAELKGLAGFFKRSNNTQGSVRELLDNEIQRSIIPQEPKDAMFKGLSENLVEAAKNDGSKKNLSSIVFLVTVQVPVVWGQPATEEWKGLFTGDASACVIFKSQWKTIFKPLRYDLIKVGHHGSCYNNFLGERMLNAVKTASKWTEEGSLLKGVLNPDKFFIPTCKTMEKAIPVGHNTPERLALDNVLAYFCNVRAKSYVISASHDEHPNPHMSTIIAIMTRAVMYPEDEPVKIYLTNPISFTVWTKILSFWLKFTAKPAAKVIVDNGFKVVDKATWAQYIGILEQLMLHAEDEERVLTDIGFKAITDMTALHNDIKGRFFNFYCLRHDAAYGEVPVGAISDLNMWHAKWTLLELNDTCSMIQMAKIYGEKLSGSIADLKSVGLNYKGDMSKTEAYDGKEVTDTFYIPITPLTSPEEDNARFEFLFNKSYFKRETPKNLNKKVKIDPADKIKPSSQSGSKNQVYQNNVLMMAQNPFISSMAMPSQFADSFMTAQHVEMPMFAKIEKTTKKTKAIEQSEQKAFKIPEARKPNWAAFRKFDVDEFEIPVGDDFSDVTQTKMKHLNSFAELLGYLVSTKKLTREQAMHTGNTSLFSGDPTLGGLAFLLFGVNDAQAVLKTFPLKFLTDARFLGDKVKNPLLWPVRLLNIVVADFEILGLAPTNASGIQQLTIRIFPPPPDKVLTWEVPNRANLLGKGMFKIHIFEYVEVTVYWPTDPKRRIVHGKFHGSLPTRSNKPESPIVGEWLMMPDVKRPVVYHFSFADLDFKTEGYEMNILDMMAAFDGISVDLGLLAVNTLLPGLIDENKPLGNHVAFSEPGFTLSRDHPQGKDLRLHGVFGQFSVIDIPDWKPFSENAGKSGLEGFLGKIQIPMPTIRLCVQDFFSETGTKVFFRINHSIKIGTSDLAYEVETRPAPHGGCLYEFTFCPVDTDTHQPLSLMKLLETFGLAPVDQSEMPGFLSETLSSVSLTSFRLGWIDDFGLRLPDYLECAIRIDTLSIADGILNIDDVFLRLRIDNPGQKERRNMYIQSGGVLHIFDIEHLASFTYGNNPVLAIELDKDGKKSPGLPLELAIRCTDTPLTLGNILHHFWKDTEIIPAPFNKVTNEVGINHFRFKVGYSEARKKQVVELVKIGLGVSSSRIEILDGLSLIEPELSISAYFPFEESLRVFAISFSAMVSIELHTLVVKVNVVTGQEGGFSVSLHPGGEGFPVGVFLQFVSKKVGKLFNIPYPESFGALDRTDIQDFSLAIDKGGIQSFTFSALSDLQLDLWNDPPISLERITLDTGYQSQSGFNFTFAAELMIDEHMLLTSVGYDKVQGRSMNAKSDDPEDKGWFIESTYTGDIDLLAIAKNLAGLNMATDISNTNLPNMDTSKDGIVVKNLTLTLQKSNFGGAIYISADTDWAVFAQIEFAATFETAKTWNFCLTMLMKDRLLSLIPVGFIQNIGEYVEFNESVVALYVGMVDTRRAGMTRENLPPSPGSGMGPKSGIQLGLSVSTKIVMTKKMGIIKNWIGQGELEIFGEVNTSGVGLAVQVRKIELLLDEKTKKYDIEIDGRFDLKMNQKGVQVGLIADMKINCPFVTKDMIHIEQAGFIVQLADAGVGFQGGIKGTLRNLFGLEGLEARGLSALGLFSIAEEGIPEELSFTGELGLAGMGGIKGRIAMYYAQRDITKCYFAGKLENVNMEAILNFFLKKKGLPEIAGQFLGGNVVINNLELEAALADIYVKQLDLTVKRGFFYEASLYIRAGSYEWSGYTCIEVHADAFQFIAMMSPVCFAVNSQTFFKITRGSLSAAEYSIPKPKGYVDSNMLKNGPVICISTRNKERPLFMTAHLVLIGFETEITAVGDSNGFTAYIDSSLDLAMLGYSGTSANLLATARVIPNQRASANLAIDMNINLNLPGVNLIGYGRSTFLGEKRVSSACFSIRFDVQIGWPNTGTGFDLSLSAVVKVLGKEFPLPRIAVNLRPEDLDTLAKVASTVVTEFLKLFPALFKSLFNGEAIQQVGNFIKENYKQVGKDLVTAVSVLAHTEPTDVVEQLGKEFLDLNNYKDVIMLLAEFSCPTGTAMDLALKMFGLGDIASAIPVIGGGGGGGGIPFIKVPSPVSVVTGFLKPKFRIGPFRPFGIMATPIVEMPMNRVAVTMVRDGERSHEVSEGLLDAQMADIDVGTVVMENESDMKETDEDEEVIVEAGASPAIIAATSGSPVQNPASVTEAPISEPEGNVQTYDIIIEDEPQPTQEQIDAYNHLIEQQIIAIMEAALEVYPAAEVFRASNEMFVNLSPKEVYEYMEVAGLYRGGEEGVAVKVVDEEAGKSGVSDGNGAGAGVLKETFD